MVFDPLGALVRMSSVEEAQGALDSELVRLLGHYFSCGVDPTKSKT